MNQKAIYRNFWLIIGITFIGVIFNLPKRPNFSLKIGNFDFSKRMDLHFGLDLAGGASLIFDIDTTQTKKEDLTNALESLKSNIERRVNLFGVSEATVQLSTSDGQNRLTVELPGVEDVDQAVALIGKTAQLNFKGETELASEATASATIYDVFKEDTGINGSHLVRSQVVVNPNTGQPEVGLEFNNEGAKLFEAATKKFLNKRLAIFLDDVLVSAPVVNEVIIDGKAVISGDFDNKTAKTLSAQLNAGALPLPIKLIRQDQVGATLGQDSIQKGMVAGLVGLVLVCLFMIGNYGYLGFIADIGLVIYGLITLTLYRLIPVTLTFPGLVGFLLSVGMAVDSNILIFERMREEIRKGKSWNVAMELGFGRAWDSIKDANICTIITGLILFNPFNWSFLNTSGMVRGFAVTLLLGIFIGIFTGVFVTRNLLRVLGRKK
ncbi:MAG TPA: protein translocase subunit SecD [Candidatus Woesebacteria bacterium]|nr:protein translocase subunit SecD [Candidatus Woesebacteria bacterium]